MSILDRALRVGESKKFKSFERNVELINAFEPELELETDDELRERYEGLRERHLNGESLEDLLHESFALTREAGRRTLRAWQPGSPARLQTVPGAAPAPGSQLVCVCG